MHRFITYLSFSFLSIFENQCVVLGLPHYSHLIFPYTWEICFFLARIFFFARNLRNFLVMLVRLDLELSMFYQPSLVSRLGYVKVIALYLLIFVLFFFFLNVLINYYVVRVITGSDIKHFNFPANSVLPTPTSIETFFYFFGS